MTEPRRLLHGEDASISALLESAHEDGPSESDRRAVATAIGLGVAAGAVATGAAASSAVAAKGGATKLVALSLAKITAGLAVAFTIGVVAGVKVERSRGGANTVVSPQTPVMAATPVAPTASVTSIASAPVEAPSSVPSTSPSVVVVPKTVPTASGTSAPSTAASMLAEETILLARARNAIAKRAFGEAIAALDAYDVLAPSGVLLQESRALRVQALAEQGNRLSAIEHGRAFLEQFPKSPWAKRVRAILSALDAE